MSDFISKADYDTHIRDNRLDQVTKVDDTLLDKAEKRAIKFMESFLSSRYDTAQIFAATGNDRDETILGFAVDITLYYLHRLINPRKVPEMRKEAYQEAKQWLEGVSRQEINPVGLPVFEDGQKDYVLHGSNPKRTNHIGYTIDPNDPLQGL